MPNYQVTIGGQNYQVSASDESHLPEIADTIAKQSGNGSVATQGLGYVTQHPFKTAFQPGMQTLTGNTLQNMAFNASQIPIPQANQRPFDSNVQMASSPMGQAIRTGVPTIAGTLGGVADAATTPSNYAISPLLKGVGKLMPKVYNDALVNKTAQSAISKIQGAIQPLRDTYKAITEPFSNQLVDSETFKKALSIIPKSARQDFIDEYGSQVLDNNGNPYTTIGNLQKMELELKDRISQPKYGQTINAQSFNYADAAKQLKQLRISQLPQGTQSALSTLDKQFGPVVNMTDFLLPKLSNKAGAVNTKALYSIFSNPADAGTRQYLTNLKNMGVDLSPEIKTLQGWVDRQGVKKAAKYIGGRAVEGSAIGGAYKLLSGE